MNAKTKNKMGGIKIPNFYASPLHNSKLLTGENTDKIQTDNRGEYSLVMDDTQAGLKSGDTIRPANNKSFKPAVIGKSQGSKDGYLIGGDYNVQKTGDKNYNISPVNHQIPHKHSDGSKHGYVKPPTSRNKFGGTPDNTDKQAAYEKAQDQLFAEGKITETDDKAVRLIEKRVKKNAKKLSK